MRSPLSLLFIAPRSPCRPAQTPSTQSIRSRDRRMSFLSFSILPIGATWIRSWQLSTPLAHSTRTTGWAPRKAGAEQPKSSILNPKPRPLTRSVVKHMRASYKIYTGMHTHMCAHARMHACTHARAHTHTHAHAHAHTPRLISPSCLMLALRILEEHLAALPSKPMVALEVGTFWGYSGRPTLFDIFVSLRLMILFKLPHERASYMESKDERNEEARRGC